MFCLLVSSFTFGHKPAVFQLNDVKRRILFGVPPNRAIFLGPWKKLTLLLDGGR